MEGGEVSSGSYMSLNKYGYTLDLGGSLFPMSLNETQSACGFGWSIGASVFGWKGGVNELEELDTTITHLILTAI